MKKKRHSRHGLECMFIAYAVIPAVVFTLVCGLLFMTVPPHGKRSGNIEHSRYVAGLLGNVLTWYEDDVEKMASQPGLLDRVRDQSGKAELSGIFYGITNSLGLEGDLFAMNSNRSILLSSRSDLSPFLDVSEGVSWDIFGDTDREPNRTVLRLAGGWKNGGSTIVIGRSMVNRSKKQGYILCFISSSQFKALMGKPDIQTIIADPFGRVYVSSNYSFLDSNNQVMKIPMESGRYLSHRKQMYLVSRQRVPKGGFTAYSISDIQNIVTSLGLGSGLVITTPVLMTLWVLLNFRKVTEIKAEDLYKILDVMESAKDGNLEDVIRIQSDNGFKIIVDAHNKTIQNLRVRTESNRRMAEPVFMTQNKQLESQSNPHFLYNTLESIRYMYKLEPVTAEKVVFNLSSLLRYSLDGSKAEVTLKEDLEHLESCLTTLRRRFGKRFRYRIDVGLEAMDLRTPELVLQPMIKNTVKYGLGEQSDLTVELKAYIHEGRLTMMCRDDGVGIPWYTSSELTALLERRENPRRYSGLYNIHRRIDILYGHPFEVGIRSAEGHGTTLVVTLLVRREGSDGCYVC